MPHFKLPPIEVNDEGWGPTTVPEQFKDVPFMPFSKSDRLGRIADFGQLPGGRGYQGTFPRRPIAAPRRLRVASAGQEGRDGEWQGGRRPGARRRAAGPRTAFLRFFADHVALHASVQVATGTATRLPALRSSTLSAPTRCVPPGRRRSGAECGHGRMHPRGGGDGEGRRGREGGGRIPLEQQGHPPGRGERREFPEWRRSLAHFRPGGTRGT